MFKFRCVGFELVGLMLIGGEPTELCHPAIDRSTVCSGWVDAVGVWFEYFVLGTDGVWWCCVLAVVPTEPWRAACATGTTGAEFVALLRFWLSDLFFFEGRLVRRVEIRRLLVLVVFRRFFPTWSPILRCVCCFFLLLFAL